MSSLKTLFSSFGLAVLALFAAGPGKAMSVIAPTFSQLVAEADLVARVEVMGQTSQWDTSPTGQKVIHTYVQCKVLKALKGDPAVTLSLRFLGGQVGNDRMEIPDMPTFATGERCIVFVAGNGTAFCPLVRVMHGKYTLKTDASGAEYVSRSNGAALHSAAEVSASDETVRASGENGMNRDDFETAITTEVRHASVR